MRALLLSFLLLSQTSFAQQSLLDSIRKNIVEIFTAEDVCVSMFNAFERADVSDNSLLLGYKGAIELGMARHNTNPFKKMSFFSDGKKHLEEAIATDRENIELRFLRLTIQVNLPTFLGYSDDIQSDKAFVLNHLEEANSESFKTRVRNFVKRAEEQEKL